MLSARRKKPTSVNLKKKLNGTCLEVNAVQVCVFNEGIYTPFWSLLEISTDGIFLWNKITLEIRRQPNSNDFKTSLREKDYNKII